ADEIGALHFNLNTASANQKFKMQFSGEYLLDNNQLPNTDQTGNALTLAPDAPAAYKMDGTLNWQLLPTGTNTWGNPFSSLNYFRYQNKTGNLVSNAVLSYQVLPGLELKANAGYTSLRTNEITTTALPVAPPSSQALLGINGRIATYSYNNI